MITKSHHIHQGTLNTEGSLVDVFTAVSCAHQRVLKSLVLSNEVYALLVARMFSEEAEFPEPACPLAESFVNTMDIVTKFSEIDKARPGEKYLGVAFGVDVYYETPDVPPLLALEGLSYVVNYVDFIG
jgi:hypothetical protein